MLASYNCVLPNKTRTDDYTICMFMHGTGYIEYLSMNMCYVVM